MTVSPGTRWTELMMNEKHSREVRRMTAAAGDPTLRLIRAVMRPYALDDRALGKWCHGRAGAASRIAG